MAVEHLHLHMRRTHWETKYHDDLGSQLQEALDKLGAEGWEVACAFCANSNPDIILKRVTADGK